jgi:sugar phosphate isomerase/epimerase
MITISAFADEIAPDLPTQMDVCEANGVRCIDVRKIDGISVSEMTADQAGEYKKQLDGRGFRVPCIGSPIGKISMDGDFEQHLELLKHCFETARALGTKRIRMFSFYPSAGRQIADQRDGVMERMRRMVEAAEQADCVLMHENEKAIYGARPAGVKDLFATVQSDHFQSIFDPANYVEEGVAPYDDGWSQGLAELTVYFHIKDKVPGAETCVPAGEGEGQIREIFTDAKARGYSGMMTLEPHMKAAGQFSGFSGPDLFTKAAEGLKRMLEEVGLPYE